MALSSTVSANEIIGLTVLLLLGTALFAAEARPADAPSDPVGQVAAADVVFSFRHEGE